MPKVAAPAAPDPRPSLTVLPGGKRLVTRPLDEAEEAWVEVQAVADEAMVTDRLSAAGARRIQDHVANGRWWLIGQEAETIEQATVAALNRAKHARRHAQAALDELRRPKPVPA